MLQRILHHIILVASPDPHRLPMACWFYAGKRWSRNGYARVWCLLSKKERQVHRLLYEEFRGPIPEGLVLDHLCRRRHCVNPWHTEPVTTKENVHRGEAVLFRLKEKQDDQAPTLYCTGD
jgi:hypothetical protein